VLRGLQGGNVLTESDVISWLSSAQAAFGIDGKELYVRVRQGKLGTTQRAVLDPAAPEVCARALLPHVASGARLEVMVKGGTSPVDHLEVRSHDAAPLEPGASTADALIAMSGQIMRISERTMVSNEVLVAAIVRGQRDLGELEGYAAGRSARPDMAEALTRGAHALADRMMEGAAAAPDKALEAALANPAASIDAIRRLTPDQKATLLELFQRGLS